MKNVAMTESFSICNNINISGDEIFDVFKNFYFVPHFVLKCFVKADCYIKIVLDCGKSFFDAEHFLTPHISQGLKTTMKKFRIAITE